MPTMLLDIDRYRGVDPRQIVAVHAQDTTLTASLRSWPAYNHP
jgi:hypothetical protein